MSSYKMPVQWVEQAPKQPKTYIWLVVLCRVVAREKASRREMAQYCRYCAYLVTGNGIWCWKREKEMTEQRAKQTNRCKDFALNPMDAFYENEKGYIPRPPREPIEPLPDQIALF